MNDAVFRDNVVVLTGASAGIGRELALQLAGRGAWLALAARDVGRLEEVAEECRERGGRALVAPTDVGEEAQCRRLIDRTMAEYGGVDTLVNNAGIGMWARFEEITDLSIFERIIRVNYLGSVYCTHYALPHLKRNRGRIVGVSSLTGKTGVPTRSAYAASKHAMAGFFDSLRIELMGSGVTVTMVYPGFVATGIRERAFGADGRPLGEGNSPVREDEVMTVEECARLIERAAAERRRELVMTRRAKVGMWLKLLAPRMVDRIARDAIERGK
ncbi:MAG: SDR family oxidoreductase [Gemmatimonadetes bacterium]|nr:SDR family oxidoreductase [Gemmatimonadota bacterium]